MPPVDFLGDYHGPATVGFRPPEPKPLGPPGLVEASLLSLRTGLTGAVSFDFLPSVANSIFLGERDPSFDPYDSTYFNEDFLMRHPAMLDAYSRGVVDDVPNGFAFSRLVDRMDEDFEARQRLGQAGIMTQIAGGILGNPHELLVGGVLARGAALSGTIRATSTWAAKGGYMQRAIIGASAGAAENMAYDVASRAASAPMATNQQFDPVATMLIGATFGGMAASIGSGAAAAGRGINRARVEGLRRDVAEWVSSPAYRDAVENGKAELAGLQQIDADMGTEIARVANKPTILAMKSPMASGSGMLGPLPNDAPARNLTVLRTPETAPLIDAMKAKYGDGVVFHEHQMQELADLSRELDGIESANIGIVGEAFLKAYNMFLPTTNRLVHAPGTLAKLAARTFWDFNRPTTGQLDNPLDASPNSPPAEGERWRLDQMFQTLEGRLGESYRLYKSSQGKAGGPVATKAQFFEDVMRDMWMFDEYKRGQRPLTAPRAASQTPGAQTSYDIATTHLRDYFNPMAKELHGVGMLGDDLSGTNNYYLPRRWNADAVRRAPDVFKDRLIRSYHRFREVSYENGSAISPMTRPLEEGVIEHRRVNRSQNNLGLTSDERKEIRALANNAGKRVDELTEGDLTPALLARYLEEVEIYAVRRAESFADNLLLPDRAHGVEAAFSSSGPTKQREVRINASDFADFLDTNPRALASAYHAKLSGRVAMRSAIKSAEKQWAPIVKRLLGKDLAEEGYDPILIQQVVEKEMGMWIAASNTVGDTVRAAKLEKGLKRWRSAFESKVAELERRDTDVGVGRSALWRFSRKQILRGPFLAYMGKMAFAQMTDLAAMMALRGMPPAARSELRRFLRSIHKMSKKDREMFLVGIEDATRSVFEAEVGDFATVNERQPFGPGRAGAMMAYGDKVTEMTMDGFTRLTGIRPVSRILKEMAWHKGGQELIGDSIKMVKADDIRKTGGTVEEALEQAGLSPERAAVLNRLGFDAQHARRFLDLLVKNGLDKDGNPIQSIDHDGYIHFNASAWAEANPEIWRRVHFAVESMVRDISLQPKLLSLPKKTQLRPFFFQFQSFMFAFGRQQLPFALHSGQGQAAMMAIYSVALGAVVDALYNQSSGRRSLTETADEWVRNPLGMAYGAVLRSPIMGMLQRPLSMLEYRASPIQPSKIVGNDKVSAMYGRRDITVGDLIGPSASWLNNVFAAAGEMMEKGNYSPATNRPLWNAIPGHNLWLMDGVNRLGELFYDEPLVGPDSRYYQRR